MYTFEPPILYSEAALRGVRSGQHPICFHSLRRSHARCR